MITRSTSLLRIQQASRNLQTASNSYSQLQNQVSSKLKINRPSDDPSAAANILRIKAAQGATSQYSRNVQDATGWLTTIDSSLDSMNTQLSRVRDLAVQGANDGSMNAQSKEAIAVELTALRDSLFKETSTNYLGRNVYAGTSDAPAAFNADYSYNGTPGSSVERRVADGKTVQIDADGAAIFGVGANSVFAKIDNMIADLRSGVNIKARIAEIDTSLDAVRTAQSTIGARHSSVLAADDLLSSRTVELEAQRSSAQDINIEQALTDLAMSETTYQTALSVTAKSSQYSLMDYLR